MRIDFGLILWIKKLKINFILVIKIFKLKHYFDSLINFFSPLFPHPLLQCFPLFFLNYPHLFMI